MSDYNFPNTLLVSLRLPRYLVAWIKARKRKKGPKQYFSTEVIEILRMVYESEKKRK